MLYPICLARAVLDYEMDEFYSSFLVGTTSRYYIMENISTDGELHIYRMLLAVALNVTRTSTRKAEFPLQGSHYVTS